MSDNYDYDNHRNFDGDTFDRLTVESAAPFVTPDPSFSDPSRGITMVDDDAVYHTAAYDCMVDGDGNVTTRAKAGPANQAGFTGVSGGTP